jgi:protocatechuate 3,4-dioxygenase beta subunit
LLFVAAVAAVFVAAVAWWTVGDDAVQAGVEPRLAPSRVLVDSDPIVLASAEAIAVRTNPLPAPSDEIACLEDGHASIAGVVADEDGVPIAGAIVAILGALHEADALRARGSTVADELGRFDVRTAKTGDVWIIAVAPGMRPTAHRCAIEEGFLDLAQPLRLERGVEIAGRVLADETPLARVELEALCPQSARRVRIGDHELALIDNRLEWARSVCLTAADGTWSFRGLAPGRWTVRPRAFRCPSAVFPPGALAALTIEAPASDVDLSIPSARLAVEVVLDGEPLAWAEVEVEYRGLRSSRRADARGRLEVAVSPSEGLAVVVRAPGRAPAREVFAGPRRGERRDLRISAGPPMSDPREKTFQAAR